MKQTFSFSPIRCSIASILGWAMLGLAIHMWLTWHNPDIGASACMMLMAVLGAISGLLPIYLMYTDYPVYAINERGLIVRQTLNPHHHYRINWRDIEAIRITSGKYSQLQLTIKDGGKHYFHAKGRAAYAKQKLKFNRTTEILALAQLIEGGRRHLYRTLCDYWACYRETSCPKSTRP